MTPVEALDALIASGEMRPDPAQRAAVEKLADLAARLDGYKPTPKGNAGGFLKRFGFGGGSKDVEMERPPEGLYIWGPVGRGKSMLMDLFYDHVPVQRKRRVHFHAFMIEVQEDMHRWRKDRTKSREDSDPIEPIADRIATEA